MPKMLEAANMTDKSIREALSQIIMVMRRGVMTGLMRARHRPKSFFLDPAAGVAGALMYEKPSTAF